MSHRTQVTLTDDQYEHLLRLSARSGVGLAELVRQAIDRSYGAVPERERLDALDASFGSWRDRDEDGAAFVDRLRRGMAKRLAGA